MNTWLQSLRLGVLGSDEEEEEEGSASQETPDGSETLKHHNQSLKSTTEANVLWSPRWSSQVPLLISSDRSDVPLTEQPDVTNTLWTERDLQASLKPQLQTLRQKLPQ